MIIYQRDHKQFQTTMAANETNRGENDVHIELCNTSAMEMLKIQYDDETKSYENTAPVVFQRLDAGPNNLSFDEGRSSS